MVSAISFVILFVWLSGWERKREVFFLFVSPMFEKDADMVQFLIGKGAKADSGTKDE